ncbi:MAG: haloacid dehalogenase-like hydrolase [Acidobacteria bacterium]|nr:haloacid dehalogenase-like hydrolase [Acidobacteriota bacterium]
MSAPLHSQNVVALIWDFDKTLIPGYMQDPIFEEYRVEGPAFWREVNALPSFFAKTGIRVHPDTCYLNHLITYVQHGRMPGLTNAKLRDLGARIRFHQGLPDCLRLLREELGRVEDAERFELRVEHYIVSTGIREMIEGSAIRPFVDGIWASEFIEAPPPPGYDSAGSPQTSGPPGGLFPVHGISQVAVAYDNTSKTRAIFEINKGVNKDPGIDVNATMRAEDRRVPFSHMIYIADGPSDVPAFSVIRQNGGTAFAVYDDASEASLEQVERLRKDGRIDHFGPADFRAGGPTLKWLGLRIRQIAGAMVDQRREALKDRVGSAPRHLGA